MQINKNVHLDYQKRSKMCIKQIHPVKAKNSMKIQFKHFSAL